jgi:hypothetical protein
MTRVEENKKQIEDLLNNEEKILSNPFAGTFEPAMVLKTTMITSLLIDISKSLAAISDDLSLKRDIEEQTRVYEQIEKREPFKPMVEIDLYSVIKHKYIEREVLDKIDEIITDALDKSTDQKESQTLRWVLDKISEVT